MKKLFTLLLGILIISCSSDGMHPDFEKNKKAAETFFKLHGEENLEAMKDMLSDDLDWSSPAYGEGIINKDQQLKYIEMYQTNYKDISFEANYWLPGVDTVSLKNNGSVRVYGTWTGVSKSTGREFSNRSYHWFEVEDGKITNAGDFFDATGMINAVGPAQRNVVVFTAKVSKRNIKRFQELMDSDAGLTVTRNWDGCTHLEAFYNEETETYFIYEYWDSYKQYEEYLDWRFNAEEPSFVQTVIPLIKGGENGMQAYYNNSTYNFY